MFGINDSLKRVVIGFVFGFVFSMVIYFGALWLGL